MRYSSYGNFRLFVQNYYNIFTISILHLKNISYKIQRKNDFRIDVSLKNNDSNEINHSSDIIQSLSSSPIADKEIKLLIFALLTVNLKDIIPFTLPSNTSKFQILRKPIPKKDNRKKEIQSIHTLTLVSFIQNNENIEIKNKYNEQKTPNHPSEVIKILKGWFKNKAYPNPTSQEKFE
ncbi:hypothetical protein H8356DRAFT_1363015 [Neocallimastix lanati (nom. inval.)]|nr:hypothetical protein H8356DRAFT_1363015 [Neocallimastix sp. JGI-2020a]